MLLAAFAANVSFAAFLRIGFQKIRNEIFIFWKKTGG